VRRIVHAGDIGSAAVLAALAALAPVTAVRGNNDRGPWATRIPPTEVLDLGPVKLYVIHDVNELAIDPGVAGFAAVISGHSHRPRQEDRSGVLYFNPGSAGPRRFGLPISIGRLRIHDRRVTGTLVTLEVAA
jgi:putative phosphoesterase